ncbi:MAG TPA: DNA gyrase subunit A [Candidatus Omnitrophota bacterium]|nr:DNA gyrase subunit A [Candidatus Omnitrophota bacterium]HPS36590.1 DNA gyrase subunit A [Candidatus Omnitrophota bacterium]
MADEQPQKNLYAMNEKVIPRPIEEEMKDSYIDYSMSVIVGRALPDVRDGLKPVHRRILFAMNDLGLVHSKPYKKSARIVGEVLGKYHPHGDTAVYDTMVRMAQDFSLRYPLVEGQGNFGSIDGDSAAAMRYTEARLASISNELLDDIDKDTVDFAPNFDESLTEPSILPAKIPTLLVNGSTGIAVGMATNIPPHNMTEVVKALIATVENPDITIKELTKIVTGPDFPTGGLIIGREGIKKAYETGRGQIIMRAKAAVETSRNKKDAIVITEIPYQVNKTSLIESIVRLVEDKKIEGVADIRDESDRDGMRLVIELKKDAIQQVVLNNLYKHTQLQSSFGVIMLTLVDGQPRVLTLKQMIEKFIDFRVEVILRRTRFELDKAEKRAHILEGYKIAISNIDKVIKIIRTSKSPEIAKETLMKSLKLSEIQAKAILELQLQRLTQLERLKIDEEYLELIKKIEYYQSVLKSRRKVLDIIREEAQEILKKYGDERRTKIVAAEGDIDIEDLIAEEDVLITISHAGYIKRIPVSMYRRQNRGGSGVTGAGVRDDEDFMEHMFMASTHDFILFFTNQGRVYWRKAYDIPQSSRQAKGKAIVNFLSLTQNEQVSGFLQVKEFDDKRFVVMVTAKGVIKKTNLIEYSRPRSSGINAITLRDKDELVSCKITSGKDEIFIATRDGKAIRFKEDNVREMGRNASGVRGVNLAKGDEVIAAEIVDPKATALTVTQNGFGKKTLFSQYRIQSRGGKGIINVKVSEKNGKVVNVLTVAEEDEIIIVTTGGMVVRCPVSQIRTSGRNAVGVRVMRLKEKDKIASATRVVAKDEENGADAQQLDLLEEKKTKK